MFNVPAFQFMTAALIASVLGISGFLLSPMVISPSVDVYLEPESGRVVIGETFTVDIIIRADVPVNVFQGILVFNPEKLAVASIDYNTSIANLWAKEPWYSNGDGTVSFIGGTTVSGGFLGKGSLMSITFTTKSTGDASIAMTEMKILKHDGLGTELSPPSPIDAIFAVSPELLAKDVLLETSVSGPTVTVMKELPSTDLNNDGKQSIVDTSIFMSDLFSQNLRSDFNQDGSVNLKDLSILNQ